MHSVRQPAVAGSFYPADPRSLATMIEKQLDAARARLTGDRPAPKAVIVPHAGYVYSGSTAALAYAELERGRSTITRVVLLGPCHRVPVRGLALSGARSWRTPLGEVPVEERAAHELPHVVTSHDVHLFEHSLEVQVPFLQSVLDAFTLVPLAVGDATPDEVAAVIDGLWGGPETAVVISSDLSHYLPYATAREVDAATIDAIGRLEGPLGHSLACGAAPINGMLVAARRRGMEIELLGSCNSGDTAGGRDRVVGYAAFALREGS